MGFTIPARTEHDRRRIGASIDRELLPLAADPTACGPHGDMADELLANMRGLANRCVEVARGDAVARRMAASGGVRPVSRL